MRAFFALTLATAVMIPIVQGQQPEAATPNLPILLTKIQSSEGDERAKAYHQLRSSPEALRNPRVRAALIDLLDRENQASDQARRAGGSENEADDEYLSELTGTVESFADWNNPRQACILVARGALPVDKYAEHAKEALPCLLMRSKSGFALGRRQAVELIVEVLWNKKTVLDSSMVETCKRVIESALHDPDAGVRIGTVHSLAEFGGEDMIPALLQVSESDPYVDKTNHNFWIREYASKAIKAIQQRAGQH